MNKPMHKIQLELENGRKRVFYQFHATHQSAWEAGENILKREFFGKGKVICVRMLSKLEWAVFKAGHSIEDLSNHQLLELAKKLNIKWEQNEL